MTPDERMDLAADHWDLAQHAAGQAKRRWRGGDPNDFLSWASAGLLAAAETWDPDGAMTFVGYARQIIRHRMTDQWRNDTTRGKRLRREFPFDHTVLDHQDSPVLADPEIARAAGSIDMGYERVDDADAAARLAPRLVMSERDRDALVEVGSGRTARAVAFELGVTESRLCQIRTQVRVRNAHRL